MRTTRVTSMPVGVPRKSSTGRAYAGFSASVISYISRVVRMASATVPPTNRTIAGAAGHGEAAQPDGLGDGRVADVGVGVLGSVARRGRAPRPSPAGPVNHCAPVPAVWMPKSVPLRASTVTTVDPGMPAAARVCSLAAGMTRLRKKWSLPPTNRATRATSAGGSPTVLDQGRQQVAQQHERAGPVAVVALVAHLHHLADQRLDVDRPGRRAARPPGPGRARRPSSAAAR